MRYERGSDDPVSGKRVPLTQSEVLRNLESLGRQVDPTSYSLMENGRRDVSDDLAAVFVRLYGRGPEDEASSEPQPAGDLAALVTELRRTNDHINRLLDELQAERSERRELERQLGEAREALRADEAWHDRSGAPKQGARSARQPAEEVPSVPAQDPES